MSPDESSVELKRPSDASEDAPSQGKKPRTGEDPLVAANALASFAGPSTEEEGPAAADASPPGEDPPPPPDKEEEVMARIHVMFTDCKISRRMPRMSPLHAQQELLPAG